MSRVRILVGTQKGAFIVSADGRRDRWDVNGPHFAGWDIRHIKGSPAQPSRLYAVQSRAGFGQRIHRSDNGGLAWEAIDDVFTDDAEAARVWHFEPSLSEPDTVYAGIESAALFRSTDGGSTWTELSGLRNHESRSAWIEAEEGTGLRTILLDPVNPARMYAAVSGAGAFRSDDGGATWKLLTQPGACVHRIAMHPTLPDRLYMQKHGGVMRSADAGETWENVGGNLPSDFGYALAVHAQEPDTLYVVPIKSDFEQYPVDGKLRVYRTRLAGMKWEPLTTGLPQRDCYVNVRHDGISTDTLAPCGLYFGTTGGTLYGSSDSGDSWTPIVRDLPPINSVEVQTLP